ncbi:MAG TPA: hypothetical protein VF712_06795 [Thermoleophilaceae bacterium]
MSGALVAFGSWKLRHGEPAAGPERRVTLHELPDPAVAANASLLVDVRGLAAPGELHNLGPERLPLAALRATPGGGLELTHLLLRCEPHVTHLLAVEGLPAAVDPEALDEELRRRFDALHPALCNFERFYRKGLPNIELEQKFDIETPYDYFGVTRRFHGDLDDGRIAGFRPQLGDEIEPWSYDNELCRISDAGPIKGYVSVMHWSRKVKSAWDEPVVTFKEKRFDEDALERWERNYHDQRWDGQPEAALRTFFDLPLEPLPPWRRTRFDVAVEALASANVFMVNFEDTRVRDDSTRRGRLQQCEIEYLKTRGEPVDEAIYADLKSLSAEVEAFMGREGLAFRRSNYSKLTFLREYAHAAPSK